jgi:hypothetical protein
VLGQKFGRKNSRTGGCASAPSGTRELLLRVAPGEVGVGLVKPSLARPVHHLRAVNASARKIASGWRADLAITTPRTRERLGVRVVDAEDAHAVLDPEQEDVAQLLHSAASPRSRSRGVDVLVLLRRVLGVLDRAVGRCRNHSGCSVDPGVVGRALEGDVERDSRPSSRGRATKCSKSSSVPSSGWTPCGRPRRRRSPTGCPGRRAGASALFGPLRCVRPIGWIGGR